MKLTNLLKALAIMLLAAVIVYPTCPYSEEYGHHTIDQCEDIHPETLPHQEGIGGGGQWFD